MNIYQSFEKMCGDACGYDTLGHLLAVCVESDRLELREAQSIMHRWVDETSSPDYYWDTIVGPAIDELAHNVRSELA